MKILNISTNDYANMSHENANALRAFGIQCDDVAINAHPFKYHTQSKRVTSEQIKQMQSNYDVIQLFHTDAQLYQLVRNNKNVIIYHTGTRYRQEKQRFDKIFQHRPIFTDQCEFLLHDPSFEYIAPHTNLKPVKKTNHKKLFLGHYPSNHIVKGTAAIKDMTSAFSDKFIIDIDTNLESHQTNIHRMSKCDVYIELFRPTQNNQPYGCFGVTAFEATALGALVITNNINPSAYTDAYGEHPFLIANDEQTFINFLLSLSNCPDFEFIRESMHSGFFDKHSIVPTGKRIASLIEKHIK